MRGSSLGGMSCPHCQQRLRVRSSRQIEATYRQLTYQCLNVTCGAIFGGEMTITHQISAGAAPDPTVHLRRAPPRQRALSGPEVPPPAANDEVDRTAVRQLLA